MRNKFYSVLLVTCILFAFACKKSSTNGTPDTTTTNKPKKYLTHTTILSSTPNPSGTPTTSTSNIYYTYDSKKRLSTVKNGDNLTTYTYYDNGDLFSISNSNVNNSTSRSVNELTYADGKLKQCTRKLYKNNVLDAETPFIYVYEGDRVTEIHWEIYYVKYTYDSNGNIVRIFNYGDPQYSIIYTYDNKKNMFFNSLFKYPVIADISRLSLNNTASYTTEGLTQNSLTTYKYNYDDEGYPTGMVMTINIANAVTSKYTYEYSTLD